MFLINGQPGENLSVQDRGLHYGDGVFETIAICRQQLLCWDKHYVRLQTGCNRLGMNCPSSDLLYSEAMQLCASVDAVLKIIITRGQGGRGYRPPEKDLPVTRILACYPWPEYPDKNSSEGARIRICAMRLSRNQQLAGIKHLNRLEQVLARDEWGDPDIAEGLMKDTSGNIIEGTMSNLFIFADGRLKTPDLTECGINGVIRACVLEQAAAMHLHPEVISINEADLLSANEIFLCNSIIGIWPVKQIENHTIATGPWTQKIRQRLIDKEMIVP